LNNFKEFISNTDEGIRKNPADEENAGDKNLLMSVMKNIADYGKVEETCDAVIQRIKDMVNSLKKT